jgi:hypothetical protein
MLAAMPWRGLNGIAGVGIAPRYWGPGHRCTWPAAASPVWLNASMSRPQRDCEHFTIGWESDVAALHGDTCFNFYPFLFTEQGSTRTSSRKPVPVAEQYALNAARSEGI